jgi:hypothetical protein
MVSARLLLKRDAQLINTLTPRVHHLNPLDLFPMFDERNIELPFREWIESRQGLCGECPVIEKPRRRQSV